MKADEIRELDGDELDVKEREAREQLFRLRFQIQMGQADGLRKYRALKRDLARILNEKHGRKLAGQS